MQIEILTIFPTLFESFLSSSLIAKAIEKNLLTVKTTNIRDFADPPHLKVDDTPYGGGGGMLMKPEPLSAAIEDAKKRLPDAKVILMTPSGELLKQEKSEELCQSEQLILIAGRYEGVDQRVIDLYVDLELSIGDYILMGGELPAMILIESVSRLKENVLGNSASAEIESFSISQDGRRLLEAPHYTRPPEFKGLKVPDTLLSGDHQKIENWRQEKSVEKTKIKRPELL